MSVQHVHLKNFTVFEDLALDFSPGINVLLGANGTGKSHLMKVVYAVARVCVRQTQSRPQQKDKWPADLLWKLGAVFRSDNSNTGRLVRKNKTDKQASILVTIGNMKLEVSLPSTGGLLSPLHPGAIKTGPASIFLPAREVLSMYEGFVSAYLSRELSFDETYFDLCVALGAKPLKGPKAEMATALLQPLRDRLHAEVHQKGDRFYVEMPGEAPFEAHLVAEGYRKLASLMYLIKNGSIGEKSVLFWDEPEANLNPRLIKVVADFLLSLAASGIQIFVATHDYLLTNELSLQAEYHTEAAKKAEIRFFGFHREGNGPAQVQTGATLADLDENPIMEEFAALYDRERNLFRQAGVAENPGA